MANVIVHDLRKQYGDVIAAGGISFEIERGEVFGLLGPNGSGKTTTLECIIGLREPDAGEIEVAGIDVRRRPRAVKERIGAVLQTISLQDKITPREALALFASFYAHGSRWRWRLSAIPISCSSTSRRPASIRNRGASCRGKSRA
jgi:ABC-2 type transport system ATP-binding protein